MVGALASASRDEMHARISAAARAGYSRLFWEINDFDQHWPERYDRELTNFPAAPIGVLNVGPTDPNFIRFFQWFDRYAERLHSVVINADNLDNYDFKQPEQQRQANRVMNALFRLIKARQPTAFVWVRVVWANDGSDVNWLKTLKKTKGSVNSIVLFGTSAPIQKMRQVRFCSHMQSGCYQASVTVVSSRSRSAIASFPGSPLRRCTKHCASHLRLDSSALTILSALASAASWTASP